MSRWFKIALVALAVLMPLAAHAQEPVAPGINLQLGSLEGPEQMVPALKILALLTIITLAPAILIAMTSFTRVIIVLSFLRQAMGTAAVPPTQIMASLALLITVVIMAPVGVRINEQAIGPYTAKQIDGYEAYNRASGVIREFLLRQTREDDLVLFYEVSNTAFPQTYEETSLHLLVPAFLISELRTGFEMGFLLFLPFILIDLIVASMLTSMGMVMLPPTMMAIPMKLLLFVVVDGWSLLTRNLIASFA